MPNIIDAKGIRTVLDHRLSELQAEFGEFSRLKIPKSPLRYPGGKNRAVKTIYALIPSNVKELCSPFLGGGSIELACTTRMQVFGADIFEPLVAFWQALLADPVLLATRIESYFPLTKAKFYELQAQHMLIDDQLEMAAAFFVLNRSSFSGTTLSGGMSPGHPRFTLSSIERVRTFKADGISVEKADFRDFLPKHETSFLYLDPPYLNGQGLYGVKGATHRGFDHAALADLLSRRDGWILSYNDSVDIREMYKEYRILKVEWTYGMNKTKASSEVLILSRDFSY